MENKYNLPEYLMNAIRPPFKPNPYRYGATELIDPPLIRTLKHRHWNELGGDVSDKLWMLHGTAFDIMVKQHSMFGLTNLRFEKVWCQDEDGNNIIVVVRPDYYNVLTGELADVKDTSVWSLMNTKPEYSEQVNIYDYFMHVCVPQLEVTSLSIHGMAKDWKKNEKLRQGKDYPVIPFKVIPMERWSHDKQANFIDERLNDHLENPERECTPEEKWEKPDIYAVHIKGNRTAKGGTAKPTTQREAEEWIASKEHTGKQYEVKFRKGSCGRCEGYCAVSDFCPYCLKKEK